MMQLPEFLQESTRARQDSGTSHYTTTFSHYSAPVVGSVQVEWWPSYEEIPGVILLFLPGNPGLVGFYDDFLEGLHRAASEERIRLAIFNRGHIGHAPELSHDGQPEWTIDLNAQVTSAIQLYDTIRDTYGPNTKFIIVGHSVGAWIATQVMNARPDTVSAAFLLFPTVSNIASTPNGRKLSWLFHQPIPTVASLLTRLLNYPPFSLILSALPYLSKFGDCPPSQLAIIRSLITSPHVTYSTLTMAHDEMEIIGSLGDASSTIQATYERERSKLYACFAAKDGWVGEEIGAIRRMLDENKVVVRDDDVPHAFCINHSAAVAETCTEWLRDVVAH